MENSIKISEDIRLIRTKANKQQVASFLRLLKKNQSRIETYFPGYYIEPLSTASVTKMIENKNNSQKNDMFSYAICSRSAQKIIGEILINMHLIEACVCYWIDKDFENKGIMSAVFDTIRDKVFQTDTRILCANCNEKNQKSISFLINKGLKQSTRYSHNGRTFIDLVQHKNDYVFNKKIQQQERMIP